MTYKELLDSVSFEEIVPYIEKYHGEKGCLALYKIHYAASSDSQPRGFLL